MLLLKNIFCILIFNPMSFHVILPNKILFYFIKKHFRKEKINCHLWLHTRNSFIRKIVLDVSIRLKNDKNDVQNEKCAQLLNTNIFQCIP